MERPASQLLIKHHKWQSMIGVDMIVLELLQAQEFALSSRVDKSFYLHPIVLTEFNLRDVGHI